MKQNVSTANQAHNPSTSKKYFFEGDLSQVYKAADVARWLGIRVNVKGGLPYVETKEDYDKVVTKIILSKVEGYWHYT